MALERLSALAVVVWSKERRGGGRPQEEGGEGHPRGNSGGGRGWNWVLLESGLGARGGRAGPTRARFAPHIWRPVRPFLSRRRTLLFLSTVIIIIIFPRKAGTWDCQAGGGGAAFPGKAQRAASAPGAPEERKPEECRTNPPPHRPGARSRPRRPAHRAAAQALAPGARVPGLTFSGAARPRTVSSLHPAPPRPLRVGPEQPAPDLGTLGGPQSGLAWALSAPAQTAPGLALLCGPGVSLFPLCTHNSASPGALTPSGSTSPGPAWTPHPFSSSLIAQDAPGSLASPGNFTASLATPFISREGKLGSLIY